MANKRNLAELAFQTTPRQEMSTTFPQSVLHQAGVLGIHPYLEQDLMWIAEKSAVAVLPSEWEEVLTEQGQIYYYNHHTDESQWNHPAQEHYAELLARMRREKQIKQALAMSKGQAWGAATSTSEPAFKLHNEHDPVDSQSEDSSAIVQVRRTDSVESDVDETRETGEDFSQEESIASRDNTVYWRARYKALERELEETQRIHNRMQKSTKKSESFPSSEQSKTAKLQAECERLERELQKYQMEIQEKELMTRKAEKNLHRLEGLLISYAGHQGLDTRPFAQMFEVENLVAQGEALVTVMGLIVSESCLTQREGLSPRLSPRMDHAVLSPNKSHLPQLISGNDLLARQDLKSPASDLVLSVDDESEWDIKEDSNVEEDIEPSSKSKSDKENTKKLRQQAQEDLARVSKQLFEKENECDSLKLEIQHLKDRLKECVIREEQSSQKYDAILRSTNKQTAAFVEVQSHSDVRQAVDLETLVKLDAATKRANEADNWLKVQLERTAELEETVQRLQDRMNERQDKIEELVGVRQELETASHQLQAELATARDKVLHLESQQQLLNTELRRKQQDGNVTNDTVRTLNEEMSKLRNKITHVEEELDAACQELEQKNNTLTDIQGRVAELETRSSHLSTECERLRSLTLGKDRDILQMQRTNKEMQDKVVKLTELKNALTNRILELQGNIRVLCRVRPMRPEEANDRPEDMTLEEAMNLIQYPADNKLSVNGTDFEFDAVFGPSTAQDEVFGDLQAAVASVANGYRACVFAYGQTGSGKTFTMEGTRENPGVNSRALDTLFSLGETDLASEYHFSVSMLEVYNEAIKDLLSEEEQEDLEIRVGKSGIYVEGLSQIPVPDKFAVEQLLAAGARHRHVESNNVNEQSSRSHLVLRVSLSKRHRTSGSICSGELYLVDLAGSERLKVTSATGQRLKEAQNINRSLSALGDVISALAQKSKHVPYRNSKLTFLLQEALSGNSKVLMFVNINPCPAFSNESICSLNFASRCRSVQLGPAKKKISNSSSAKTSASSAPSPGPLSPSSARTPPSSMNPLSPSSHRGLPLPVDPLNPCTSRSLPAPPSSMGPLSPSSARHGPTLITSLNPLSPRASTRPSFTPMSP